MWSSRSIVLPFLLVWLQVPRTQLELAEIESGIYWLMESKKGWKTKSWKGCEWSNLIEKSRTQTLAGYLPLLFASCLWFFLWVALFTLTTYGFSLSGEQHGPLQHLNFISYNLVKERLGEIGGRGRGLIPFLSAKLKNSRDLLGLTNQLVRLVNWLVEGVIQY